MTARRFIALLALVGVFSLFATESRSVPPDDGDDAVDDSKALAVKAALLLNFTKFITWPDKAFESPSTPIRIGIVGEDPFGEILDEVVKDQRVQGRTIEVQRLKNDPHTKLPKRVQMHTFHVIFISRTMREKLKFLLSSLEKQPILTVADFEEFAVRGGVIELEIRNGRVAFRINPKAAERAGLTVSSRLLSLATIVREQQETPR